MEWNQLSPRAKLFKSRKFWLLILDTVISTLTWTAASYYPGAQEAVKFLIITLQPVIIMVIMAIAWEDTANAHR